MRAFDKTSSHEPFNSVKFIRASLTPEGSDSVKAIKRGRSLVCKSKYKNSISSLGIELASGVVPKIPESTPAWQRSKYTRSNLANSRVHSKSERASRSAFQSGQP